MITYLGFVQPLSKAIHGSVGTVLCHRASSPLPYLGGGALAKLAGAARCQDRNGLNAAGRGLSSLFPRGPRMQSKTTTYFHLRTNVRLPARLPNVRALSRSQPHREPPGLLLFCRHWRQSRWQHPPPTFPGSVAFRRCSELPLPRSL